MFVADLHVHSKFSRATSSDLTLESLFVWAQKKGIDLVGTGDFTHPGWLAEIEQKLVPASDGLLELRPEVAAGLLPRVPPACRGPVRFVLQVEISSIYKFGDRVRKVHNVILLPHLDAARAFNKALSRIGNLASDGRPILGLDSRNLLEIALTASPDALFIPAHIWTPWFSALGSRSGFDSIAECFRDLAPHVFAVETGLSSDPPMNRQVSTLDGCFLVSSSDAHSAEKLGREATRFACPLSWPHLLAALRTGEGLAGTIEFFPEEGKYHLDGHRKCNVRLTPAQTRQHKGLCPQCGKPVTVGVLHRVFELADRAEGSTGPCHRPHSSLVGLAELLAERLRVASPGSAKVQRLHEQMLAALGPEIPILLERPLDDIGRAADSVVRTAIERVRDGKVILEGGFDGEFGTVRVFAEGELERHNTLFAAPASSPSHEGDGEEARRSPAWLEKHSMPALAKSDPPPGATPASQRGASSPSDGQGWPEQAVLAGDGEGLRSSPASLNPEQQSVVDAPPGPCVVIAGPGTGKTRVLVHRIAHLLEAGEPADSIVALTFTRKAAGELRARVLSLCPAAAHGLFAGTFHSFALDLLARGTGILGLPCPRLCSPGDRDLLAGEVAGLLPGPPAPALVLSLLEGYQVSPENAALAARARTAWERCLESHGLIDLDLVLPRVSRLLEENPGVADSLLGRVCHVLVDEFQDIDEGQYALVRLLGRRVPDLLAIGDPDQSIYGFRGGSPAFFQRLEDDLGAGRVTLRESYRSSAGIRSVYARVLAAPGLEDGLPPTGDVTLARLPTERAEAEYIAHSIEQLVGGTSLFSFASDRVESHADASLSFGDLAVLTRTSFLADAIEEALSRLGIPLARPARPSSAFTRMADAFEACLRQAAGTADRLAGRRIERFAAEAGRRGCALSYTRITAGARRVPLDAVEQTLAALRLLLYGETAAPADLDAFDRLLSLATGRGVAPPELPLFLATLKEEELAVPGAEKVSLMTLHAAKGLEFEVVFIAGLEDGLLPYTLSGAGRDVEEERRLLYVGLSRGRRLVHLTSAACRTLFGRRVETRPSPFLVPIQAALAARRAEWKPRAPKPPGPRRLL